MAENEVITFGAAFDPSGVARGVTIANQKLNELSQSAKRNEAAFASASLSTSRFSEKGVATLRALSGESKKTSTAFQQLAADVRLAQADFAAGRIGSGDLATALNVAQQSAIGMRTRGIVPMGTDLGAFNRVMQATVPHMTSMGHGSHMVSRELAMMGAMALGTSGSVGKLGAGLAMMSMGGLTSFGIIAGFAAIAGAFTLIGKSAREAKEKIAEFLEEQRKAAIARLPESARLARTGEEAEKQIAAQRGVVAKAERAARALRIAEQPMGTTTTEAQLQEAVLNDKKAIEARKVLAELLGQQAMIAREVTRATEEEFDQILKATGYEARINDALRQRAEALEALRTMRPEMAGPGVLPGTRESRIVSAFIATETLGARAEKGGLASILAPLSNAARDRVKDVLDAEKQLAAERAKATLETARATQQLWGAIISGASNLIQSLIRGEASAGSVVGGIGATIGGALAVSNPLLGLGILGASGILGALFGGGKKELPVRDDSSRAELARLRQDLQRIGPDRVVVVLRDEQTGTERILYEMNRRTRRDAQPRLPPGMGI